MDKFLDTGPSHASSPTTPGQINLLLLAPHSVLLEALQIVFVQFGCFKSVIHCNGPEYLNDTEITNVTPLVLCAFIDSVHDVEKLRRCKSLLPSLAGVIAVCEQSLEVAILKRAVREGAHSLISFTSPLDELILAIKGTARGEKVLSKDLERILVDDIFNVPEGNQSLTRREQQVLNMVCSGQTMKEIAYSLKLSPHTIQYYHRSVMEKVGVNRTADLIVYAMRSGLYSG
jgi:two-component system, NarL family, invasion response regulator UvrY